MKKYKILYTIPNFNTAGSGKAMLKIAENLDKNIFEPSIICLHDKGDFFQIVKNSNIPVNIYQFTTNMKPRLQGIINIFKIAKYFKTLNIDLIHSFHYAPDYSEALAAKIAGIKWVYTKKNMNWGGASKNGWKLRTLLADGILAQNTDMVKQFFHYNKKVKWVPIGVDLKEFKKQEPSTKILNEFNLPVSANIILTVANLVPVKGVETLIKAFAELTNTYENLFLIIVGDNTTEYATSLTALTEQLALKNKVIFTGKRLDVKDFYSISKIFVLPTLEKGEGSPAVILESMASGVYTIGSNVSGITDQLKYFPSQIFLSGNSKSLNEKLKYALNLTDKEYQKVIHDQYTEVIQNYDIKLEVKQHEEFYLKVLNDNL